MNNTMEQTISEIVDEFEFLGDWQERYAHIIEMGRGLPALLPEHKIEDNRVKGCQSQVWLISRMENGRLVLEAESDALIVQGLIALLLRIYSGRTPQEIVRSRPDFLRSIGLDKHLSQNRTNGLHSMLKEIHRKAQEAAGEGA